jgi:hypothetical protein
MHRSPCACGTPTRTRWAVVRCEGQWDTGSRVGSAERRTRGLVGARLLHRKEDDQGNAAYWYSRAAKPVCREPLDAELQSRQEFLLRRDDSGHARYISIRL